MDTTSGEGRAMGADVRGGHCDEEFAVRVMIVSPVRVYREAPASVLAAVSGIGEVAACEESVDALSLARRVAAHVLLLDARTVNSSVVARLFARDMPLVKVVALTPAETARRVPAFAEAGVAAYLPREGSIDDLVAVVGQVVRGERSCPPVIAAGPMHRVADPAGDDAAGERRRPLSTREREVADHIVLGMSNRAIAATLGIQTSTVKNHVHRILAKLGTSRRSAAARYLGT